MAVQTTNNKPINPRGNDQSPKGYNRAALYSGKALSFDGVNDEVNCGNVDLAFNEISFAFHFNADSFSNDCIFQKESVFRFIGVNTNQIDIVLATTGNSWYSKKMTLTNLESKDYFLVATYNGSELKAYLNGVLVDTLDGYSGSVASVTQNIYLGRSNGGLYYDGKMSGARIFNTALTAAQVADLYNNPEKIVPTGVDNTALKLFLPMQEGAGTTAYDGSGNGNHGTISGATWTHGIGSPVSQTAVIDWNKASNLVIQSNDFITSWTANSVSLTIAQAGPTGINDAWKLEKVGAYGNIVQGISVNNASTYTFSIIAKAGNTDFVSIRFSTGAGYDYRHKIDLTDGTTSTASGNDSSGVVYKTQNIGNGWWRFGIVCTTNSTSAFVNAYAGDTADASGYVYIAHTHAEETNELKPYVRTYASSLTDVLLPQGLTSGRDITGVNLFENVRKQGALNLDGNSWAEVHDNASLDVTTGVSVECWFYNDGTSNGDALLGKWYGGGVDRSYMLWSNGSSDTRFYINSSLLQYTATLSNGWHHVIGTYDQAKMRFYIDGSEKLSVTQTAAINTSALPLEIGRHGAATSTQYANQIAQPRIYNRALTAEEIERNYSAGKNTYKN